MAIAALTVGCNRWDRKPGRYIQGTNAMTGVSAFIATNGWTMSTNVENLWRWEDIQPHYIHGLPWTKLKNQEFQALTYEGILYVLSNEGWHHDYGGVAYNPRTNRFPSIEEGFGFKPIGGHWYVWVIPELSVG
ncbi:MAG TPA: hypothetical protein VG938_08965 [Verrucomicrobiae bacterium]|nr:hypothetical protein [Verrucomicrobiae bacterium]